VFLTQAELAELTGREKPSAQIRELERQGIAHVVNAAGRPVVTWAAVNARMGTGRDEPPPAVIDFSCLRRA